MAEESVVASSGSVVLPGTLEETVVVPSRSVSECCTRHGRMLGARQFAGRVLDSRSRTMVDFRSVRYDADIGDRERRS